MISNQIVFFKNQILSFKKNTQNIISFKNPGLKIRVNCVSPGMTNTAATSPFPPPMKAAVMSLQCNPYLIDFDISQQCFFCK